MIIVMQKNNKLYLKLFLDLEIFVVLTFNLTIEKKLPVVVAA